MGLLFYPLAILFKPVRIILMSGCKIAKQYDPSIRNIASDFLVKCTIQFVIRGSISSVENVFSHTENVARNDWLAVWDAVGTYFTV